MKEVVFISHSVPEDNYRALWLASKLKILGFNAWVDLEDLAAGDAFNSNIGPVIKNRSKVFLALTTAAYAEKALNPNSGVSRELNASDSVDLKTLGHNFVLPIRFDAINFKDFPYQYQGKNAIDFAENWQEGLIHLVRELERINVARADNSADVLSLWYNGLKNHGTSLRKEEYYFSNWFPFSPPADIYVHTPKIFVKEQLYDRQYPYVLEANRVITFASRETVSEWIEIEKSSKFSIHEFCQNETLPIDSEFILIDPKKKLIRLLHAAWHLHLRKCGLICWRRGTKKTFYFRSDKVQKLIPLKRYGKVNGKRAVVGKVTAQLSAGAKKANWAFALDAKCLLDPVPHFRIFYSVVFSDDKYMRFNQEVHHQLRRSVCSTWYNREWYEKLLASMLVISSDFKANYVGLEIDKRLYIELDNEPMSNVSNVGYIEPNNDDED